MVNQSLPTSRRILRSRVVLGALAAAASLPLAGLSALRAEVPATRPAFSPATQPIASSAVARPVVDLRKSVEFLASEDLEGRASGSPGIDIAAGYIASTYAQIGLKPPAGWKGYFQSFKMTTSVTVDPKTMLAAGEGKNWAAEINGGIQLDRDYKPLGFSSEGKFDAPVAFAGYGVTAKHHEYDDYEGLDVKGKVVLVLRYEPAGRDGVSAFTKKKDEWSDNAAIPAKAKLAASHGALGLVIVNPPNFIKEDVMSVAAAGRTGADRVSIPVLQVKRPVADAILKAGGIESLAKIQETIDTANKPASKALADVRLKTDVILKRTEKDVRNVAAVLPGSGPNAGEYIVIGAHYDHLGRGGPGSLAPLSKDIHSGADDNASGTSAMLKIAEELSRSGPHDRSILFVAFTAEELGLLGSAHFVANPPVPTDRMVAMLNFDMVGRIREQNLQVGGSGTAPSFEKILKASAEGLDLKLSMNSKGGMGPSDHTSFATKRIPVLFFFSGLHGDYHRPTDTADKVNYDGIENVVTLGSRVAEALTTTPKEAYVATFDRGGMMGLGSGGGSASGGTRASLGIVPDYSDDSVKGIRISGTSPGSAAEKAGLKGGDTIVAWNDSALDNLTDMMGVLVKGKPGDKVKLKVLREGKEITLEAVLTERKG